ncbi:hypothetical protein SAMN05216389_10838 [Oceanobacillus limi]|uniref:Uncharacterized protein n=1 Tax=Oceanobacillus limi TaxID=930131 RepID=A0A1I0D8G5_9BACI|nr:hypothetical protein [Oceanobacillus limi]SET27819.1 hypothetical protein SAMN05216389_10838 [Oceanobacillus limi]
MREFVGECMVCGKDVFCENGFLVGIHEDGELMCNQCSEAKFEE